ncbi:hypothetical protein AUQ37_08645 [Candidatus Methanomethylophilus sp. 1R26]|uniref:hypothetical protein n=1 Tax=Candidatus Methanomethylophilus sp. 1R26 TaxID=1769296 RepID=UPI000735F6E2|nr:hypothetical protein [Candidatus Methanomethylophilus sp. 1R26]KUE73541.1 hypothetical protein AUQ37_08645 [Candidatus Methanomethylophilus sp. 1R26]
MSAKFKLNPGDTKAECNRGRAAVGAVVLLIGLAVIMYSVQFMDVRGSDDDAIRSFIILMLGMFLMTCGVGTILSAFYYTANTMYVKKGRCTIMDGGIACSGGCKSCSVALVYIDKMNGGNEPEPRERP